MCQPAGGGDSPLETIRRHLLPLLGKYDLFVLLDNSSALSNQPWVHEMIRDLQPREVDFQDTVKAEWEWLSRIEGVACMAKLGFYQARRLRKCWNMVRQRERQTGVNYTHLVRVRPDLRIPRTLGQMLSQPRLRDACWHVRHRCWGRCENASLAEPPAVLAIAPWAQVRTTNGLPLNDILYVVRREHARPLFDHLEMVLARSVITRSSNEVLRSLDEALKVSPEEREAAHRRTCRPLFRGSPKVCDAHDSASVSGASSSARRLQQAVSARWWQWSYWFGAGAASEKKRRRKLPPKIVQQPLCGNECLLGHALSNHVRLVTNASGMDAEARATRSNVSFLRVRYLAETSWDADTSWASDSDSVQLLRIANVRTDGDGVRGAMCKTLAETYACAEKTRREDAPSRQEIAKLRHGVAAAESHSEQLELLCEGNRANAFDYREAQKDFARHAAKYQYATMGGHIKTQVEKARASLRANVQRIAKDRGASAEQRLERIEALLNAPTQSPMPPPPPVRNKRAGCERFGTCG